LKVFAMMPFSKTLRASLLAAIAVAAQVAACRADDAAAAVPRVR
jgi:hypothetical protein